VIILPVVVELGVSVPQTLSNDSIGGSVSRRSRCGARDLETADEFRAVAGTAV
jgi:hypothetical protein